MRCFLLLTSIFLMLTNYSYSQTRLVYEGYLSGNDYLKLTNIEKSNYLIGVADGLLSSRLYLNIGTSDEALSDISELKKCLMDKIENNKQLRAIVEKYLTNNPERWSEPMGVLFFVSIKNICL